MDPIILIVVFWYSSRTTQVDPIHADMVKPNLVHVQKIGPLGHTLAQSQLIGALTAWKT
jgi:hypothetical protein